MAQQSSPPPAGATSSGNSLRETFKTMYPEVLKRAYILPSVYFNRLSYRSESVHGIPTLSTLVPKDPALSGSRGSLSSSVSHASTSASHKSLPGNQPSLSASQVSLSAHQPSMSASRYSLWTEEPQPLSEPKVVQESDVQDDKANDLVFPHLRSLLKNKKQAMFVLAGLKFDDYSKTFAAEGLPVPEDLNEPGDLARHQDVEVDYLFIHPLFGIVIAELKSIGCPFSSSQTSAAPDGTVGKRVRKAVEQLDRARKLLTHLVSDVGVTVDVRTTLFLPYVTSDRLQRVLDNDDPLLQAVCGTLGCDTTAKAATKLCCCDEQFEKPENILTRRLNPYSELKEWWERRMVVGKHSPPLSDVTYQEILYRLAGPAVKVEVHCSVAPRLEVRTEGEAVAELGRRFARLVLTEDQLLLLKSNDPFVYLSGPPGTGKTLLLVLKALSWLLEGDDVHVVTLKPGSRAVCEMIVYQLNSTLDRLQAAVCVKAHLHCRDLKRPNMGAGPGDEGGGADVSHAQAIQGELEGLAAELTNGLTRPQDRPLRVIVDEAEFGKDEPLQTLVTMLEKLVPGKKKLYVWTAGIFVKTHGRMKRERLEIPLRSAPVVLRQVNRGVGKLNDIHNYAKVMQSRNYVPLPGDGPDVHWLDHGGPDHQTPWPATCYRCGEDVAEELGHLNVGKGGPLDLKWSDVLVLTRSSALQEEAIDDVTGLVTSEACGVVRGLRDKGVPVCVLERRRRGRALDEDLGKVGQAAEDRVTVSHWNYTSGLERAVTVYLPGVIEGFDDDKSGKQIHREDMMAAVSRCTTQLIVVRVKEKKLAKHFVE